MDASASLTLLTRIGFAARGLLYIVIALLVIRAGRAEDPGGALDYLARGGGRILLWTMAAGFTGYGLWRLSDAALNIERHEAGNKGLRERIGAAGSGIVHLLLAYQAVKLAGKAGAAGSAAAGGGSGATLALPGGGVLLAIASVALIGIGAFQLVKAANCDFCRKLDPRVASRPWVRWSGRLGYAARGLVFMISGYFLLRAFLAERSAPAAGMDAALAWLSSPWDWLVAVGLALFGLFSLVEARFRSLRQIPVAQVASAARAGMSV